jgi:hypothetical protein
MVAVAILCGTGGAAGNVINGSFEDGLSGWSGTGFAAVTGPHTPTDGQYYAHASFTDSQPGSATLSQQFVIPSDADQFLIDIALYSIGQGQSANASLVVGPGSLTLWEYVFGAGTLVGPENHFRRSSTDLSSYAGQQATLLFEVSVVPVQGYTATARLDIDRIQITRIPEPTTMLLAAGLAVVGDRRWRRRG